MPKWIKIEVKDGGSQPARSKTKAQDGQSTQTNWLIGLILGSIAVIALAGLGFVIGDRVLADRDVVAVINGEPITQDELLSERILFATMGALTQGRALAEVQVPNEFEMLNQVIGDRLKYQVAAAAGFSVAAEEIENQIRDLQNRAGFSEAQLQAALSEAGVDRSFLAAWLGKQITVNRYVNSVVVQNVPPALQQDAIRTWTNELQTTADVEIRLGASGNQKAAKVGEPAPDFVLATPTGQTMQLANLRGRPVLLNFWATWCPPCKIEMPDLEAIHQKYADRGLAVVAVDQQEAPAAVQAYFNEMGLSFPTVIDSTGEIFNLYRAVALPMSYFVDSDGIVRIHHRGLMTREQMENYVAQMGLINQNSSE